MLVERPTLVTRSLALSLIVALLVLEAGQADIPKDYTPIAPPEALHHALDANLKVVINWLDEKDYISAVEATRGLVLLTQLYGFQSSDPAWRKRTQTLQAGVAKIAEAARRKSAADADKAVQEFAGLLDSLAKAAPKTRPAPDPSFRPFGANKTWMTLMEGAYRDARRADKAKDVELFALAIAEESNVVGRRSDTAWRQANQEVIDLALQAARQAQGNELEPALKTLKTMYQRCEACHNRTRK